MKRLTVGILLLFIFTGVQAQLKLSECVQYSHSSNAKDKQLFLIDFWATWCAPCITASEYLGVLQEQFPDNLYIISIAREDKKLVAKSLEKHPSKLAVSIDFELENFTKYKVHSLPYGVLLNADGNLVWSGNPADLKPYHIKKYLRKNKKRIAIGDFLKYIHYENVEPQAEEIDGHFKLEALTSTINEYPQIMRRKKMIELEGTVQQLVAYLLGVTQRQVTYKGKPQNYKLTIKNNTRLSYKAICRKLLRRLKFKIRKMVNKGEVLFVKSVNPGKFWDSVQYNWGDDNSVLLVDENQFIADNILCSNMLGRLGDLCNKPVLMEKPLEDEKECDWQVHYRFPDLMIENLADYGIEVELKTKKYPSYSITKR